MMDLYQRKIERGDPVITTDGKIMKWLCSFPAGSGPDYSTSSFLYNLDDKNASLKYKYNDCDWFRIDPDTDAYKRFTYDDIDKQMFNIGDIVKVVIGIYAGRVGTITAVERNPDDKSYTYDVIMKPGNSGAIIKINVYGYEIKQYNAEMEEALQKAMKAAYEAAYEAARKVITEE